jgi:tellurite resistance protein
MFGWKKKAKKAVNEIKKMENRGAVEASVWGGYYIAFYDGDCSADEVSILNATLDSVPEFTAFAGEIAQLSTDARNQFNASKRRAGGEALRKLTAIAGTTDAVDVLNLCIDIAEGKDGIGDQEMSALKNIAQALALNLEKALNA